MIHQKILERDIYTKPGKKVYYWLSDKTRFEMNLKIFTGVKDVKLKKLSNEERDKERKKKLILFLLIATSYGHPRFKRSLNLQAGDRVSVTLPLKR